MRWMSRMITHCFKENKDYQILLLKKVNKYGIGGSNKIGHIITLNMAKELYALMEIKSSFRIWIKRMIGYGFVQNVGYQVLPYKNVRQRGGQNKLEHAVTIHNFKEGKDFVIIKIKNDFNSRGRRKLDEANDHLWL